MASIELKLPTDLQAKFDRLAAQSNEILDKCLESGAKVVEGYVRNNLVAVLSNEHKNGELVNALGITSPKTDSKGIRNIKVGFREPRKDQQYPKNPKPGKKYQEKTNALIANIIEHGKSNQPARPFLAPAKKASRSPAIAAMERTFNEEVAKA